MSKKLHGQSLHLQCPGSKVRKFRILPLTKIVERGQNPKFIKN